MIRGQRSVTMCCHVFAARETVRSIECHLYAECFASPDGRQTIPHSLESSGLNRKFPRVIETDQMRFSSRIFFWIFNFVFRNVENSRTT